MNIELESQILFAAKSLVGDRGFRRTSYDSGSIPEVVTAVCASLLDVEVSAVGVEARSTDLFSLVDLGNPTVVYSSHYLELIACIRRLFWLDIDSSKLQAMSRSLFLEVLAEKIARRGHTDLATRLYLESWAGDEPRIFTRERLSTDALDAGAPVDGSSLFLAISFHLAHELGHFVDLGSGAHDFAQVAQAELPGAIRKATASTLGKAKQEELIEFALNDPNGPLSPDHIGEELKADSFALVAMIQCLADDTSGGDEGRFNAFVLAYEVTTQLCVISWLERVEAQSHQWSAEKTDLERMSLMYRSAAMSLRAERLIAAFRIVVPQLAQVDAPDPILDEQSPIGSALAAAIEAVNARAIDLNEGVETALHALYTPSSRTDDLVRLGEASVRATDTSRFVRDARAYCDIAAQHGDGVMLAALRNMLR
jgi:hypothetical protein